MRRHSLLLLPIVLTLIAKPGLAETLTTENFKVTIGRTCPEGNVTCDAVQYTGVDLRSGASIRLTGRTVHSLCADGVTPCRFLGYEFRNGSYRYQVLSDGTLQVYQGERLLLEEQGTWK